MAETTTVGSDMSVGLAMLFGALGFLGALVMYVASVEQNQVLTGWGFALAIVAGALLVAALHLYK